MKKIRRAVSHSRYVHYQVQETPGLTVEQANHIDNLFFVANAIIDLSQVTQANQDNHLIFPISHHIVTELNTWKYGLEKLDRERFSFVGDGWSDAHNNITSQFERYFRQVTPHRNLLQHYKHRLFDHQEPARVKLSEYRRLDPQLAKLVESGVRIEVYGCYIGDFFCSSDRTGRIREVHLGPSLPHRVGIVLQATLQAFEQQSSLIIKLRQGLNYQKLDLARQHGRQALMGTGGHAVS